MSENSKGIGNNSRKINKRENMPCVENIQNMIFLHNKTVIIWLKISITTTKTLATKTTINIGE